MGQEKEVTQSFKGKCYLLSPKVIFPIQKTDMVIKILMHQRYFQEWKLHKWQPEDFKVQIFLPFLGKSSTNPRKNCPFHKYICIDFYFRNGKKISSFPVRSELATLRLEIMVSIYSDGQTEVNEGCGNRKHYLLHGHLTSSHKRDHF